MGLFDTSPSQVSAQSQDLAAAPPPPAVRPSFQQTPVQHTPEVIDPLDERRALSNGPVIKEEPSDMDAICETSELHGRTGTAQSPGDLNVLYDENTCHRYTKIFTCHMHEEKHAVDI